MTPSIKLLASGCGLWILYYGIEKIKHEGRLGKHVYNIMLIPCLLTSAFLILSVLNLIADSLLSRLAVK